MMMLDEFKDIDDFELFSYIEEGNYAFLTNDDNWNSESRKIAKDEGADYMIKMFNSSSK